MKAPFRRCAASLRLWTTGLAVIILRSEWGILLALSLGFIAASAFLTRSGLPRGTDAELHVYRAAELGYALRNGAFYPRWAPNLYLGYGYPIFNYYAPLTYYLANLFALAPGVDIVAGTKAVFVLGHLLAALGSYALGRELFGRPAGIVAAASFVFAPYVLLIDPHARGDLAEHFAVCLLPFTFVALRRLMSGRGGPGALVASVVTLSSLVISHNLLALIAAALLGGYWLWEVVVGCGRTRAWTGIVAFAISGACTAFFWIPGLAEWGAVELVVTGPGHFDFRNHFVALAELLAPSPILDLGAAAPKFRFNLGVAQWCLALPLVIALPRKPVWRRAGYYAIASAMLLLLMLRVSTPLWEVTPMMAYLQFPWRLLGPASLMLAVCAAAAVATLVDQHWRSRIAAAALALLLVTSLPALYPPEWPAEFGPTGPADIIRWEAVTGALGTTSTRDFVPKGAALVPMHPTASLLDSHAGSGVVDKVNRATIPDGASVTVVEHSARHDLLDVSAPQGFLLRVYTFYFPGWRAYIDGHEVKIDVADPEGFITVEVPEGQHEVLVRFEDTLPRTVSWGVTAVGAAALVVASEVMRRRRRRGPKQGLGALCPVAEDGQRAKDLLWFSGVVVCFVLVKGAIVDPNAGWMRYRSPPGQARPVDTALDAEFGEQIGLIGFDLEQDVVRSGGEVDVTLYWRAVAPATADYQSFVHLARPLHLIWGQEDHLNPGDLPTTRWPRDKYVRDEYRFAVLPGTPPGEYSLNVGLYSMAGGYRLIRSSAGAGPPDSLVIATIQVMRPRRPPPLNSLGMTDLVSETYSPAGVTLLGFIQEQRKVDLGQPWTLTLFWRADQDAPSAITRELVLVDAHGGKALRFEGVPGGYPAQHWMAGDIVRDPISVPAAADTQTAAGRYQLGIRLLSQDSAGATLDDADLIVIGHVKIREQ